MNQTKTVRPSPIAGRWYPGSPQELAASVDAYIAAARLPSLPGEVIAVMAPHAGHVYSGAVAGYAFAAVRGSSPEVVVVVSPMHHPYPYTLLTSLHRAYATPLGEVAVDAEALAALESHLQQEHGWGLTPVAQDPEHSLEIEIPFLQRALTGTFRLLPVMVRSGSGSVIRSLGAAIAKVVKNRKALLVASTDLSHFYQRNTAEKLDNEMLRRVAAFDPQAVLQAEEEGAAFACGSGALAAVMWAARQLGADRAVVLRYATSGDITGDYAQVVGYGAAVFTRPSS